MRHFPLLLIALLLAACSPLSAGGAGGHVLPGQAVTPTPAAGSFCGARNAAAGRIPTRAPTLTPAGGLPEAALDATLTAAMAAAEALHQADGLALTYEREEPNPNANGRPALVFFDGAGHYWIDRETLALVEYNRAFGLDPGEALPLEDLRSRAAQMAERLSPGFSERQAGLVYSESSKDGTTLAFRWEAPQAPGQVMPPLLQVVLAVDGTVLHYINTLDL